MGDIILDAMMCGHAGKAITSCSVVNGDFETGDLTGWTCDTSIGGCSILEDTGNHYAHVIAG